jgi:hypothetical protein
VIKVSEGAGVKAVTSTMLTGFGLLPGGIRLCKAQIARQNPMS